MSNVLKIIHGLLGREGGYVNNPHDRGGETIWGITVETARRNKYMGSMRDMPREVAVGIYYNEYFVVPGFNKVQDYSSAICEELFDTGVLSGPSVAVRFLQRSLNLLNRTHTDTPFFKDLVVDGALGNASLSALRIILEKRGSDGELVLLRMLNCLQGAYFVEITERREQNEEFTYGWFLHRVEIAG